MSVNYVKAPFPWFGGKSQASPAVWDALGDVVHYVEPFAGSLAVLLRRPHTANRAYHSETVNDTDGLIVNAWRAIQLHPDATAEAASNPVAEADLHARHLALVRWRDTHELEHLMGDPAWCNPTMAGWWLWGVSCWIGGGWCSGTGPWTADDSGRLVKQGGAGVNRPRPHLSGGGQGVNHPNAREPGVSRPRPHLGDGGQGVNRPQLRERGTDGNEFHPVTMPELRRWFAWLSARLRHVRILNGDWSRCVTRGATKTINVGRGKGGVCGLFLDPPYADTADRRSDIYAHDSKTVAHDVRAWCIEHGADTDYRIVLAGFEGEHDGDEMESSGWTAVEWFKRGFLTGGMGNIAQGGGSTSQQHRERLWLSPHCLTGPRQATLFDQAKARANPFAPPDSDP